MSSVYNYKFALIWWLECQKTGVIPTGLFPKNHGGIGSEDEMNQIAVDKDGNLKKNCGEVEAKIMEMPFIFNNKIEPPISSSTPEPTPAVDASIDSIIDIDEKITNKPINKYLLSFKVTKRDIEYHDQIGALC
ncbi:hypothetical protein PV327_007350 [Microctonus hyperodae]|uniref:Uncharacterized protein n=1 Tax=Microctonus hyperodae TaxID=165561 RepID=A0AA39G0A9_MICHY|nr:hypothetical protein PV327_007350 [Microctonus hyperodae]